MTKYEGNDRYQFQPRWVKAYRQVRYRPKWFLYSVGKLLVWLACGARKGDGWPFGTRHAVAAFIWTEGRSLAAMDMGHYWSHQEMIEELRGRCKPQN
jgi:hypothetical protein